jgi:hypothetical protein
MESSWPHCIHRHARTLKILSHQIQLQHNTYLPDIELQFMVRTILTEVRIFLRLFCTKMSTLFICIFSFMYDMGISSRIFLLICMFGYLCLSFRKEVAVDNSRLVNRNSIASLQVGPNRPYTQQLCFPFYFFVRFLKQFWVIILVKMLIQGCLQRFR